MAFQNPRRLVAVITLSAAVGCGADPEDRSPVLTEVDTLNGVVHVHHSGEAPQWETEPLLTLGTVGTAMGAPSPEEFGRVVKILADGKGRLYIADAMSAHIQVFSGDGSYLKTLGQKGGGPGEVEGLSSIAWLGDTIVVADPNNARLTLLSLDGEYRGQWPWAALTGSVNWLPWGGPGEVYAFVLQRRMESGRTRAETAWARFTLEGPTDTLTIPRLTEPPAGSYERCESSAGWIGYFENPYATSLLAVPAPHGERAVAITDAYRIAFLNPTGDTVRVLSRSAPRTPLPDEAWSELQAEYDKWKADYGGADCEGGISQPEHMPVLRALHFSHDGRMLVEYNAPTGPAFDVFSPEGIWAGTMPMPDRDESVPPFLRSDRLYIGTKDSLDVQQVRVFKVHAENDGRPRGE